jgi:hypothetical protein
MNFEKRLARQRINFIAPLCVNNIRLLLLRRIPRFIIAGGGCGAMIFGDGPQKIVWPRAGEKAKCDLQGARS